MDNLVAARLTKHREPFQSGRSGDFRLRDQIEILLQSTRGRRARLFCNQSNRKGYTVFSRDCVRTCAIRGGPGIRRGFSQATRDRRDIRFIHDVQPHAPGEERSLEICIAAAYAVKSRDVQGPGWLDTERFDITAKAPPGTSDSDFLKMYRALLADRFGLRVHTVTKEAPGFALKIAKGGIKLQDAGSQPLSEPRLVAQRSNASHIVSAAGMTMEALARQIEMRLNVPVADMTGTSHYFVVNLEFRLPDPNDDAQGAGPDRSVLFAAVQDQAGLRLESMKIPVQTIVVDSVDRKPTPN